MSARRAPNPATRRATPAAAATRVALQPLQPEEAERREAERLPSREAEIEGRREAQQRGALVSAGQAEASRGEARRAGVALGHEREEAAARAADAARAEPAGSEPRGGSEGSGRGVDLGDVDG